jgi:hypothetical protein
MVMTKLGSRSMTPALPTQAPTKALHVRVHARPGAGSLGFLKNNPMQSRIFVPTPRLVVSALPEETQML